MSIGYLFSLASALSFAGYIVVGKLSESYLEPITLVFYLSFLAFFISLPIVFLESSKFGFKTFKEEIIHYQLWLHVGCIFFAMWSLWQGVSELNPATATMLGRTETLWTVILACLIYKERFSVMYCVAFVFAIAGIVLMQGDVSGALSISALSSSGVSYILLSSVCFAAAEMFSKNISQSIAPSRFALYRHGLVTMIAGSLSLSLGQMHGLEPDQWLNVILAAFLGPGLARLLYLYSLQRIDLIKSTLLGEIEPVFTALVSFLILKEIPSFAEWTGGALMVMACLILILSIHFGESKPTLVET
jgi:drug/metabolite transporter (DMT)-like permease